MVDRRITRADALRAFGATATAVALGSAGMLEAFAATDQDAKILRFALALERLQAQFYRQALTRQFVSGELAEYTRVVHGHEVAHVEFLEAALGSGAGSSPAFGTDRALASRAAYQRAAVAVEDLGVAAYDGQIPNLSTHALIGAAEIVSVEARHAGWIRDLAGLRPAPYPADDPLSPAAVRTQLAHVGITIGGAS